VRDVLEPLQNVGVVRSVSGNNSWAGPVNFASGTADVTVSADSLELPLATAAGTSITKRGAGTLRMPTVRTNTLSVQAGTLQLAAGGGTVGSSAVKSLTVAAGGVFDLTDHALAVDYATSSPLATVRGYLRSGALIGSGALGYGEASQMLGLSGTQTATFYGLTVDATTVLVRNTVAGDATLDGRVNFDDLLLLAKNYNLAGTAQWRSGDFDYNGTVNFDDLLGLAKHYNEMASTAPPTVPGASAEFNADVAAAFAAAVPEPAIAGLVVSAAAAMMGTRRRRRV
jgi:hypothetical protein